MRGAADVEEINAQASVFMKQGIRLMDDARPEAIAAALGYFDRALELRRGLPFETSPMLRYDLAACWLNRADALMRLGNSEQIQLALCAYDEGNRSASRSTIARGLAISKAAGHCAPESWPGITIPRYLRYRRGYSGNSATAIEILEARARGQITDRRYLLAAVWMNLANARLAEENTQSERTRRGSSSPCHYPCCRP